MTTHCVIFFTHLVFHFFFFSSRRRHTRSKRDWSSDVCSSDLSSFAPHFATCLTTRLRGVSCTGFSCTAGGKSLRRPGAPRTSTSTFCRKRATDRKSVV